MVNIARKISKVSSKGAVQKTAKAIGDLISNKIANRITTKVLKKLKTK